MYKTIRVFISSTFQDMQNERNYLNRVIFPRFRKDCRKRNVSFYGVDLRWGITEEESNNNKTIELCLKQVEECQPFFIGLLGTRYGWIPDNLELLKHRYEWIKEYEGCSATELEMIYYLMNSKDVKSSFFAQKKDIEEEQIYDDGHAEEIENLKKYIVDNTGKSIATYGSVEELGEQVYQALIEWLDIKYPKVSEADSLKQEMGYYRESLRQTQVYKILNELEKQDPDVKSNFFKYAGETVTGFDMFESVVTRGKKVCYQEPENNEHTCNKYFQYVVDYNNCIPIYLQASEKLQSAYEIMKYLLKKLIEKYTEYEGYGNTNDYRNICKAVQDILSNLKDKKQLYIIISNLHLLSKATPDYFLSFLPERLSADVHIIVSTADETQIEFVKAWDTYAIHSFPVIGNKNSTISSSYLANFLVELQNRGKKVSLQQINRLFTNGVFKNKQENELLMSYLVNYSIYDNLEQYINKVADYVLVGKNVFDIILEERTKDLDTNSREVADSILWFVSKIQIEEHELREIFLNEGTTTFCFNLAMEAIRPLLSIGEKGYMLFAPGFEKNLKKQKYDSRLISRFCEFVIKRLEEQSNDEALKDAYTLMWLLIEAEEMELLKHFVGEKSLFNLAQKKDYQLLRIGWKALYKQNMLNMEEIYPDFIGKNVTMSYRNPLYDFFMKVECSIRKESEFECQLDIPGIYSTKIEGPYLDEMSIQEDEYYSAIKGLAKYDLPTPGVSLFLASLSMYDNFSTVFNAYVHDVVCKYAEAFKYIKRCKGVYLKNYLSLARQIGNFRMMADAWGLINEGGEKNEMLEEFSKKMEMFH